MSHQKMIDTDSAKLLLGLQKLHREKTNSPTFLVHQVTSAANCSHMMPIEGARLLYKLVGDGLVVANVTVREGMRHFNFSLTEDGTKYEPQLLVGMA